MAASSSGPLLRRQHTALRSLHCVKWPTVMTDRHGKGQGMRRWLRWIVIVLLAAIALLAVLWSASRLLSPTAEQRRAVEVFEQLPAPRGSNAFPALWLLQWDVPEAEQA